MLVGCPVLTVVLRSDPQRDGNVVPVVGELDDLLDSYSVTDGFMPVQSSAPAVRRWLSIEELRALRSPARTVFWTGRDYAIAVQLDAEDRVVNACLAKNFREPGLGERLLARIGIK
jgi:hypothetical protein